MKGLAKVAMLASTLALGGGCDTTPKREIDPQLVEGSLDIHKKITKTFCEGTEFDVNDNVLLNALQDGFDDRVAIAQARIG